MMLEMLVVESCVRLVLFQGHWIEDQPQLKGKDRRQARHQTPWVPQESNETSQEVSFQTVTRECNVRCGGYRH
jgi:hypothetical protein